MIHRKEGKLPEACREIPFMGFSVDSGKMEIRVAEERAVMGLERIEGVGGKAGQEGRARAKELLEVAGFLNYIANAVHGGFARLRAMWRAAVESAANAGWRESHFLNPWAELNQEIGEDLGWWEWALRARPGAKVHRRGSRSLFWHPRLAGVRELAREAPKGEVIVLDTDTASEEGRVAFCEGNTLPGRWPDEIRGKEVNWKELWRVLKAVRTWGNQRRGKLILTRTDNKTAVWYLNRGGGSIPGFSKLGREAALAAARYWRRLVVMRIEGRSNVMADALSRFWWDEEEQDEWEERRITEATLEKVVR